MWTRDAARVLRWDGVGTLAPRVPRRPLIVGPRSADMRPGRPAGHPGAADDARRPGGARHGAGDRVAGWRRRPDGLPAGTVQRRRAAAARAALHEPRFAGLLRRGPAGGHERRAVCALFALRRGRYGAYTSTSSRVEGQAGGRRARSDTARAEQLYERVFLEFGDDSVAQLGGAHLACEWSSNVLTKILQRGRLAAYLEQSTRYIPYDRRMPSGRYRYYWDERLRHALRRGDGAHLRPLLGGPRAHARVDRGAASARRRAGVRVGAIDQGEGARLDARAAARRVAEPRGRVRLGPGVRAAVAAPAGLAAARGARVRRAGAARAAQGDPGLREAGRHARPRRCVDRVHGRRCASGRPRRRRASASTTAAAAGAAVGAARCTSTAPRWT